MRLCMMRLRVIRLRLIRLRVRGSGFLPYKAMVKAMSVETMEILTVGAPVLRRKAKPVRRVNQSVRDLLDAMLRTMYAADGVGLAAPQVGIGKRIIVVDVGDGPVELINPEITHAEGEQTGTEGCLSVPGKAGEVRRAKTVRVTGLDRHGRRVWLEGSDLLARALQHEIDHLDGILFIDRADRVWDVPPETTLRIVFMGTPEFAVPFLQRLVAAHCEPVAVVTQPEKPRGRGMQAGPSPVKEAALACGLEVLEPEHLRDNAEFLEALRSLRPDVIVTVAYGKILPREILELPRLGCLNVHPSLLPRYRGAAPIHRALMNGDQLTGVTVMRMSEEMDAGDIVLQRELQIDPEEDRGALEARLAEAGAELLLQALRLLATGEAPRRPQDHAAATYAPRLAREEERIDWHQPAERVINLVRALSPRPGAHTLVDGEPLKILRAAALSGAPAGAPGEVVEIRPGEGFVVRAKEGAVLVRVVQPAGGRVMPAAAYLNGRPLAPGTRLG